MTDVLLDKIRKVIEANLDNQSFSIDMLCHEVQLSRSQLHRKIKQQAGLSTSLYIRKIRIERAAELLLEEEYNISEVSYLTGIDSPQNFSKYFSEQFGISPSQYRKNALEERRASEVGANIPKSSASTVQSSYLSPWVAYAILIGSIILGLFFIIKCNDTRSKEVQDVGSLELIRFEDSTGVMGYSKSDRENKDYLCM